MALLGVNIDHIATIRNARGGLEPDPIEAAKIAEANGADGITVHLREDRRHIKDADLWALKEIVTTRLNLEMAATDEMVSIAVRLKPYMVTLVPERREEVTTEGGLDVVALQESLTPKIAKLRDAGIAVSLFINAVAEQVAASKAVGATAIELHTGEYAHGVEQGGAMASFPLKNLIEAAKYAGEFGLQVNAGHGLTYENVQPVLVIPGLVELNIGHNIISRAVFTGLGPAVAEMKRMVSA